MQTFYVTWVEGTNGGYGQPHPTLDDAKKEAERLAQLPVNMGKPVRVLQLIGIVTCKNTIWEQAEYNIIPF